MRGEGEGEEEGRRGEEEGSRADALFDSAAADDNNDDSGSGGITTALVLVDAVSRGEEAGDADSGVDALLALASSPSTCACAPAVEIVAAVASSL